ncbi:ABC transporter ATP-binding protein [Anaerobranca gottschalkii]|uniref:ABC-2 type transport system ATP-binding protein n=1 Tax=Anaerobranca gottschalkii DSM 13577 TaxID=1120990 RepID=A0A1H9YEA2_9FIRM|nr:ATP-binding cassette domain-containing protein [Anaerobranca gottschalkii]SES67294.1 ABC-2 type transport system ATP-binding protein [Anaerobranca gottschalkii DSM 13577]
MIEINNLSKSYYVAENGNFFSYFKFTKKKREIKALNNINLKIEKGETVGLIGMNGAGKSTLIKLITGILYPSKGEIKVFGHDPTKHRLSNNYRLTAVFGQRCQLRWDISVFDSYKLLQKIYKVSDNDFQKRVTEIVKVLALNEFLHQPVRTLSLGQKMRAELGAAFIHDPELILLDEPTIGLDILSKESILDFIKKIKEEGNKTIILTTHDVSDIQEVCNRVIVLDKGNVIIDDLISNIEDLCETDNKVIITNSKNSFVGIDILSQYNYKIEGNIITIFNIDKKTLPKLLEVIFAKNDIREIKIENAEFKDVLKKIYQKNQLQNL